MIHSHLYDKNTQLFKELKCYIILSRPLSAQTSLVGHWTFDDPAHLTRADAGNDLVLYGTQQAAAGFDSSDGAVRIGVGSYSICPHGIAPGGGVNRVNEFCPVIDVKVPDIGRWYCMYQVSSNNTDNGEWFIRPSGNMGVDATGYTPKKQEANEWYRIGISVKNGSRYDYYIDGRKELTGNPGSIDGRFSLDAAVLLFADENREDNMFDAEDVKILLDEKMGAGHHAINRDGTNSSGIHLSSGTYFYRFVTQEYREVKKAVLIR